MKPGARPHWGMKICPGTGRRGKLADRAGRVDVFGQIEVTRARARAPPGPRPDCGGSTRPRSRFGSPHGRCQRLGVGPRPEHGFHVGHLPQAVERQRDRHRPPEGDSRPSRARNAAIIWPIFPAPSKSTVCIGLPPAHCRRASPASRRRRIILCSDGPVRIIIGR